MKKVNKGFRLAVSKEVHKHLFLAVFNCDKYKNVDDVLRDVLKIK